MLQRQIKQGPRPYGVRERDRERETEYINKIITEVDQCCLGRKLGYPIATVGGMWGTAYFT